jgi:hypothetical protein
MAVLRGIRYSAETQGVTLPKGVFMDGTILVYGNEEILLKTRGLILEKAGYKVFTAQTFGNAMLVLMNYQIDVCVLCQSLTAEERRGIVETARALQPENQMCSSRLRRERSCDRRGGYYSGGGEAFHTSRCGRKHSHSKTNGAELT